MSCLISLNVLPETFTVPARKEKRFLFFDLQVLVINSSPLPLTPNRYHFVRIHYR